MTWEKREVKIIMKWCRTRVPSRSGQQSYPHGTRFCLLVHYTAGCWKLGNHNGSNGQKWRLGDMPSTLRHYFWMCLFSREYLRAIWSLYTGLRFKELVLMFLVFRCFYISVSADSGHENRKQPGFMSAIRVLCVCVSVRACVWAKRESSCTSHMYNGVWNTMHVSSLCLQMLYEIGQAQSKPCGINLARANTLGGLLIIEKASAPINVAL